MSGGGSGSMSLRDATANSVNTVYAQLGLDVGPENFTEMAKKMGITSELGGYPAEALGGLTEGVSVLEMSNAYATLANGGVHHDPTAIQQGRVPRRRGRRARGPRGRARDHRRRRLRGRRRHEGHARATAPRPACDIGCPAAGKTGTTEEQSDAWFVGYTPHVSTAVWAGNPDARVPLPGYGADLAAPIWHDYMHDRGDLSRATTSRSRRTRPSSRASTASNTTSSGSEYDYDDDSDDATDDTTDDDDADDGERPTTDGDPNYDPDLYAPGAGQEPLPAPDAAGRRGRHRRAGGGGGGAPASGGTGA